MRYKASRFNKQAQTIITASLLLTAPLLKAQTTNIEIAIDGQYFPENSANAAADYHVNANVFLGIEHSDSLFNDMLHLNVDGHVNYNDQDDHQTLIDFNELSLNYYADEYAISAGMVTEFWGVTESWHLVDILNQTNVAANIDEETKLGQPMAKLQFYQEWGTLQFYWMPYFRERIFPSDEGRLRTTLPVDDHSARYESNNKEHHQDVAFRYSHTFDYVDLGLSYFNGTNRTPILHAVQNDKNELVLAPYYWQNEQLGLDLQITLDGLLLKLEAISSTSDVQKTYQASVTGFEYTQVGIFDSSMDLGYLAEYLYDERDAQSTTPFADDVFLGLRLVTNTISQSTFLLGSYIDNETHHSAWRFEMESRIKDGLTMTVEGQYFSSQDNDELLYNFKEDHYITIGLQAFF